jgi:CheY-like chemotaxis protein
MRTRHSLGSSGIPGTARTRGSSGTCGSGPAPPATKPAILLVSNDTSFCENLRREADRTGRQVVPANGLTEAVQAVRSAQLAAVLLDLDLPSQGAWEIADDLLEEAGCPPVILLTGRRDQFDVSTAIRAGSLVDKSAGLAKVLELVDQALSLPDANRGERNAIQRIMIQWLRPCAWSAPVTPAYCYWGLNE